MSQCEYCQSVYANNDGRGISNAELVAYGVHIATEHTVEVPTLAEGQDPDGPPWEESEVPDG